MIIKTYSAAAVMIVIGGLVVAGYINLALAIRRLQLEIPPIKRRVMHLNR